MGAVRRGRRHRPLSEINVTPFVDVMLVLLIIFMVTAPLMQQGIDVDLPETHDAADPRAGRAAGPHRAEGRQGLRRARARSRRRSCATKLAAIFEGAATAGVFLRADKEAPYGMVAKALAAAREAGATKLGMVTEPEK